MARAHDLPLEQLAMAAHSLYCADKVAQGLSAKEVPALVPWDQLPEDLRQANRAQVADIPDKLSILGYGLTTGPGKAASELHFTNEETDRLAKQEHERWMKEREEMGWQYDPVRDNTRKFHPCLVPWEDLPESEKEKDREVIRKLPKLIDTAGLHLQKQVVRK
ncbi:MAG: RyR domain-containing protein [Candidatus Sulfotelmatobacter sp.]